VDGDDPARFQKLRPSVVSFAGACARLVPVEVKQIGGGRPVSRYFGRASLMDLHPRIDTGVPDVPFEKAPYRPTPEFGQDPLIIGDGKRIARAIERINAMHEARALQPTRPRQQYRAGAKKTADLDNIRSRGEQKTDPSELSGLLTSGPAAYALGKSDKIVETRIMGHHITLSGQRR